jgi:hypothetical protein
MSSRVALSDASKAAKDHIESIKKEILETAPEGSRAERDYTGMLNLYRLPFIISSCEHPPLLLTSS